MRTGGLAGSWWLPRWSLLMTAAQIAASLPLRLRRTRPCSASTSCRTRRARRSARPAAGIGRPPAGGPGGPRAVRRAAAARLLGWWRVGRRSGESWVLVLALIPGSLLLVQGYGGEGIYRIYVFMCLWLGLPRPPGCSRRPAPERGWARYALAVGSFLADLAMITADLRAGTFGPDHPAGGGRGHLVRDRHPERQHHHLPDQQLPLADHRPVLAALHRRRPWGGEVTGRRAVRPAAS